MNLLPTPCNNAGKRFPAKCHSSSFFQSSILPLHPFSWRITVCRSWNGMKWYEIFIFCNHSPLQRISQPRCWDPSSTLEGGRGQCGSPCCCSSVLSQESFAVMWCWSCWIIVFWLWKLWMLQRYSCAVNGWTSTPFYDLLIIRGDWTITMELRDSDNHVQYFMLSAVALSSY